jgi:hypothetical protein
MARHGQGPHSAADVQRFQQALRSRHTAAAKAGAGTSRGDWARPMQYDESGFPIPPSVPTFAERVRRLLFSG